MKVKMDELKQKIIKNLKTLGESHPAAILQDLADEWDGMDMNVAKNKKLSDEARKEGNKLFLQNKHNSSVHHKILQFYNRSTAYAPNGSEELASAYGNRSALLRHVRKYAECIIEVDKALKITESLPFKVKLLCRKADCHTCLGSSENRNCLQKAKFLLSKSNDADVVKAKMSDLIAQTQSIIEAGSLDEPKEDKKKMEVLKLIAETEKRNIWDYVKIEYNKKLGRHLVAARDFEPGDVVFVEKSFMNNLDESKRYLYCSYCWNYLWTVYPCDNCAWRLFCSEQCKTAAWDEYHDKECSILVQIKSSMILEKYPVIPFLISTFIKILKEAGSIDQLRKDVEAFDQFRDETGKEFPTNGELKEYDILYNLPLRHFIEKDELDWLTEVSTFALLGLTNCSALFSTTYGFGDIERLMKDDTAIFVGAFILKIFMLVSTRYTTVRLIDPYEEDNTEDETHLVRKSPDRVQKSYSFRSLGFLTTTNCLPNVLNFFTYDNRHVIYSLSPIKKGSVLVASMASIYDDVPKQKRQTMIQHMYNRSCDCQACVENWSTNFSDREEFEASARFKSAAIVELSGELQYIRKEIGAKSHRLSFPDPKLLARAKCFFVDSWKHFSMPSIAIVAAVRVFTDLLAQFHVSGHRGLEKIDSCKI